MKNFYYKKIFAAVVILFTTCVPGFADDHKGRLQIGTGFLYERGMDLTVAYEHETRYHNAWEYFGNVYLKWDECASCGHVCPEVVLEQLQHVGLGRSLQALRDTRTQPPRQPAHRRFARL